MTQNIYVVFTDILVESKYMECNNSWTICRILL